MKRLTVFLFALALMGTPPASADHVSPEQVKALIRTTWPASHQSRAIAVARCESRFNPHAKHRNRNGTIDRGVFQLNSGGTMQSLDVTAAEAFDYRINIAAAYRLWKRRGWRPWVCTGS